MENAGELAMDRERIRVLILDETRFFLQRDFQRWAECWLHDESASILECRPAFAEEITGWKTISEYMRGLLSEGTTELGEHVEKTDFVFHIGGDLAFVSFKENGNSSTRLLRRTAAGWKICHVGVVYTSIYRRLGTYVHDWATRSEKLEQTGIVHDAQ